MTTSRRAAGSLIAPGVLSRLLLGGLLALGAGAAAGQRRQETKADLQYEFAERLYEIEVYKTAAAEYRRFLKDYPGDARREEARYKLALSHFRIGGAKEQKKALAEFVTLRKEFPTGKRIQDGLFRAGHIRYLLGDPKGAVADLTELSKLKVRADLQLSMHHFLGRAYHDLGQDADAVKHLRVVAAGPKGSKLRPFALVVLADAYLKQNDPAKTATTLALLLRDHPKLPTSEEMWLRLGEARLVLKQYAAALAAYAKVAARGAYQHRAALGRGRALLGLKKYDEAARVCSELLKTFRETPANRGLGIPQRASYVIGLARFSQQKYPQSAAALSQLLAKVKQGPMAEDGAYKLCWCYYRMGDKYARKLVESCVAFRRLFPASKKWTGQVIFLTAEGYLRLGQFGHAATHYRQVPSGDPSYADALYRTAYCRHREGKAEEAARAYDEFARKFGTHQKAEAALASAGGLYQAAGKHREAIERYKAYVASKPKGANIEEVMYHLGLCYAKLSKFQDMAGAFRRYTTRFPKGRYAGSAFYWIGRHHRIRGDTLAGQGKPLDAAKEYALGQAAFQASIGRKGPNRDGTLLALAECRYNLGTRQADQAAELASRAKGAKPAERQRLAAQAAALEKSSAGALVGAAKGFLDLIARKSPLLKAESVYLWTGAYFRDHDDPTSAIRAYQGLLERFKTSKDADAALYELALLHGAVTPPDHKATVSYCDTLLERHKNSPYVLQAKYAKAGALYTMKQYGAARTLYTEVSKKARGFMNVDSVLKLGHIALIDKDYADAARHFEVIGLLHHDPDLVPEALHFAGKANLLLKERETAVKWWQQLIQRYPTSKWIDRTKRELRHLGYVVGPDGSIKKKR